jgi:oligopeptidase B
MGAVINSDPELFGAVVSACAVRRCAQHHAGRNLPLTPGEWPEWGNPIEDKAAFDTDPLPIRPYDNVVRRPIRRCW